VEDCLATDLNTGLNIQDVSAILIGILAAVFVALKLSKQFIEPEENPKCDNCPVSPKNLKIEK